MKVLCIQNGLWVSSRFGPHNQGPKYGDICHVYEETETHYSLIEYPLGLGGEPTGWNKKHFIPLSNIDERDLVREYKEKVL